MQVTRFQFESDEPDETTELLRPVSPGIRIQKRGSGGFQARARGSALPMMGLFKIELSHGNVLSSGLEYYSLTLPREGSVEVLDAGRPMALPPGKLHLQTPGAEFDLRTAGLSSTLVANLDAPLVRRHLRTSSPGGLTPELPSEIDLGRGSGASLLRYLEFLWSETETPDSALRAPVVAAEAAMLVTALLADAIQDAAGVGPTRATCDREEHALRSAEEYLRAHVAAPVALAHVAEASGVSIRTLSRAFRKQHGMGPIRFLATLRFEATKSALLAASPEETSVTRVALAHGFASLGRFAVQYRVRFGESPSQTLNRESAVSAATASTSPSLS